VQIDGVIGKRSKGMGFWTSNFHAAAHLSNVMLCFGVQHHAISSSNEMHRKPNQMATLGTKRMLATS